MTKTLALLVPLVLSSTAWADDQEDLDSSRSARSQARQQQGVREVERGLYMKANVGGLIFVGSRAQAGILQPGTSLGLTLGQDFIDNEKSSAAWEVFFHQSLNNGAKYFQQAGLAPNLLIQGDIHTFTGGVAGEYSTYITPRFGIGARAGAGVSYAPLLMNQQYYQEVVLAQWGNPQVNVHTSPHVLVFGGPTLEYYTKLSHFSVGIDASFAVYLGLDMGIDATGYLKYTF